MKRILSYLVFLAVLSACMDNGLSFGSLSVETDVSRIDVPAEFSDHKSDSVRRVLISANRSWYAHLNDKDNPVDPSDTSKHVSWGRLSASSHQNLIGNVQDIPLDIIFRRNKSDKDISGVLNVYSDGRIVKTVAIRQRGAVYHLAANVVNDRLEVTSIADTAVIHIDCNTNWSVRVDDGATADVKLSRASGFDPGDVEVIFADNLSKTEKKKARIIVSATNCEDVSFDFEQAVSTVYFVMVSSSNVEHGYHDKQGFITFRTNTKWSISEIKNSFHNFSLSSNSGNGTEDPYFSIKYSFDIADDPAVVDSAHLRITSAQGIDPVDIIISQRGHLTVMFDGNKCFTPKLPTATSTLPVGYKGLLDYVDKPTNRVNFVFTTAEKNEYCFSADFRLNSKDVYNDPAKALVLNYLGNNDPIGKGVRGIPPYWKLPGIDGMVMTKIIYHLTPYSGQNLKNKFLGWLYTDDYCYGPYSVIEDANRNTIPTYGVEITATQLHQFKVVDYTEDTDVEFDLADLEILQPAGRGITVASNIGAKGANAPAGVPYPVPDNVVGIVMNALVKSIEIFYEPTK